MASKISVPNAILRDITLPTAKDYTAALQQLESTLQEKNSLALFRMDCKDTLPQVRKDIACQGIHDCKSMYVMPLPLPEPEVGHLLRDCVFGGSTEEGKPFSGVLQQSTLQLDTCTYLHTIPSEKMCKFVHTQRYVALGDNGYDLSVECELDGTGPISRSWNVANISVLYSFNTTQGIPQAILGLLEADANLRNPIQPAWLVSATFKRYQKRLIDIVASSKRKSRIEQMTHQLTENNVRLLCDTFNLKDSQAEKVVQYWLQCIEHQAGNGDKPDRGYVVSHAQIVYRCAVSPNAKNDNPRWEEKIYGAIDEVAPELTDKLARLLCVAPRLNVARSTAIEFAHKVLSFYQSVDTQAYEHAKKMAQETYPKMGLSFE